MVLFFIIYSWYFGKVSRNASEEWLLQPDFPKGTFLIRQGEATPGITFTPSLNQSKEKVGVSCHGIYLCITFRNQNLDVEIYKL